MPNQGLNGYKELKVLVALSLYTFIILSELLYTLGIY